MEEGSVTVVDAVVDGVVCIVVMDVVGAAVVEVTLRVVEDVVKVVVVSLGENLGVVSMANVVATLVDGWDVGGVLDDTSGGAVVLGGAT